MPTNVNIPSLGESVSEAVLIRWLKQEGEAVKDGEPIAELETDKANVDLPANASGVLRHAKEAGETVHIGETIARIDEGGAPTAAPSKPATTKATTPPPEPRSPAQANNAQPVTAKGSAKPEDLSPAVRRIVAENKVDTGSVTGTGRGGRITKQDVEKHVASRGADNGAEEEEEEAPPAAITQSAPPPRAEAPVPPVQAAPGTFDEACIKRVPMSKIRKRIAERLVSAQHTAAILTTFNEVDLTNVIEIRTRHKERFEKTHGVGLGFMSFFAKAVVLGLKEFPHINAEISGEDIVYHRHVHLGIAVSTDRGLAVPVLRNAESMSFATIEAEIKRLAKATRDGRLSIQELTGGTFTITNGGVFGSLLSTPIINPPQSGILGMHAIQKRAMVVNDKIEIRPMMYVALSYDHRIVDGKESVSFLVRLKEYLEDPARLMLEI